MMSPYILMTLLTISTGGLVAGGQNEQPQFYQMKDQFSPQVPPPNQIYSNKPPLAPLSDQHQQPSKQQQPTSTTHNYPHNLVPARVAHQPTGRADWSAATTQQQQPTNVPLDTLSVEQLLKQLQERELLANPANSYQQTSQLPQRPPVLRPQQPSGSHQVPPQHNNMLAGGQQPQPDRPNKATREQKELKARLIELANRATSSQSNLQTSNTEALLRVDTETGAIIPVEIDPQAAVEQEKLRQALKALSAKGLPADRLRPLLGLGVANDVPAKGAGFGVPMVEQLHPPPPPPTIPAPELQQRAQGHQAIPPSPPQVRQPEQQHGPSFGLVDEYHVPYTRRPVDVGPMVNQASNNPIRHMRAPEQQTFAPTMAPRQMDHQEHLIAPPIDRQNLFPAPRTYPQRDRVNADSLEEPEVMPTTPQLSHQENWEAHEEEPEADEAWYSEEGDTLLPDEPAERVRFELDDRIRRISDLLYFRPEFMNLLLRIDDASELSPLESEFKRMVLCNSDEQFCEPGQHYGDGASLGEQEFDSFPRPPQHYLDVPEEDSDEEDLVRRGERASEQVVTYSPELGQERPASAWYGGEANSPTVGDFPERAGSRVDGAYLKGGAHQQHPVSGGGGWQVLGLRSKRKE